MEQPDDLQEQLDAKAEQESPSGPIPIVDNMLEQEIDDRIVINAPEMNFSKPSRDLGKAIETMGDLLNPVTHCARPECCRRATEIMDGTKYCEHHYLKGFEAPTPDQVERIRQLERHERPVTAKIDLDEIKRLEKKVHQEMIDHDIIGPDLLQRVKHDSGKLRYDLIPVHPLRLIAEVFTMGAEKYAPRNWEKGMSYSRIVGALMRHLEAWRSGETHCPEDGQHHLASVAWCCMALMEYEYTGAGTDDLERGAYMHTMVDLDLIIPPYPKEIVI